MFDYFRAVIREKAIRALAGATAHSEKSQGFPETASAFVLRIGLES
jgi:hypothetical protein